MITGQYFRYKSMILIQNQNTPSTCNDLARGRSNIKKTGNIESRRSPFHAVDGKYLRVTMVFAFSAKDQDAFTS